MPRNRDISVTELPPSASKTPPPVPRTHYAVSEIAMALATRQRTERMTKAVVSNANAKSAWQVTVEVGDPDPDWVLRTTKGMTDFLVATYPPPVNGDELPKAAPKPKGTMTPRQIAGKMKAQAARAAK
jgi:hypothetical protein